MLQDKCSLTAAPADAETMACAYVLVYSTLISLTHTGYNVISNACCSSCILNTIEQIQHASLG